MPRKKPKQGRKASDESILQGILGKTGYTPVSKAARSKLNRPKLNETCGVTPDFSRIKQKVEAYANAPETDGTASLLKKFLNNPRRVAPSKKLKVSSADAGDLHITAVKPKRKSTELDFDEVAPTKAIVWSKSKRRIEGKQG